MFFFHIDDCSFTGWLSWGQVTSAERRRGWAQGCYLHKARQVHDALFFIYLSKVFVNCAKSSVWLCLYCYIIVTIAKVARKVSQILNPKWYILNGQQSNIKGTYFAGPLLILQHWKGKSQLSKVQDFMGRPAALVGRNSFSFSVWRTGKAD